MQSLIMPDPAQLMLISNELLLFAPLINLFVNAEVQDADGKVLVKTDGSASSGATAQQGTLMPARTEVAAPVKSHPRVAMWCAPCAASHPALLRLCGALLSMLHCCLLHQCATHASDTCVRPNATLSLFCSQSVSYMH